MIKNKINQNIEIIDKIFFELIKDTSITTKEQFQKFKNKFYKWQKMKEVIPDIIFINRYNELIKNNKIKYEIRIAKLIRKRAIRSLSWVSVISILTKNWICPWKCIYCPSFENLPKSYLPNEPAVMRAILNKFNPISQVQNRLHSLEITWHNVSKCDVRIIGGTWSNYPKNYQENFIKWIYDAHNTYDDIKNNIISTNLNQNKFASFKIKKGFKIQKSVNLLDSKNKNENSKSRVIWIAIETRPDFINEKEIKKLRKYWITRVEIWYQTTFDKINQLNWRGHWNLESIKATKLLKDAWFKIVAHLMPNLFGSNPKLDLESVKRVFEDPDFRPDEIKIYPTVVVTNSSLEKIWQDWKFKTYSDKVLINLMTKIQTLIPEYVRLNRMYRDIPATEILAWSHLANLRQITDENMKKLWIKIQDISHREVRLKNNNPLNSVLNILEYEASWGKEYFLQFIDPNDKTLFSLLRFRIPSQIFSQEKHYIKELQNAAIIREVHTFWDQLWIWEKSNWSWQHMWFGKKLIQKAEEIIKLNYPQIKKIAVISWVWVRQYYKNIWYKLEWEYMVKKI
jgi:elongator complex protein 3